MFRRMLEFVVCGAVCAGVIGCGSGSGLVPATGKVIYGGKPVAGATVTFVPSQGTPAIGVTNANGEFSVNTRELPGVAPGRYMVGITKMSSSGDTSNLKPEDMMKMMSSGQMPKSKNECPAKYAAPQTSGLQAEVTADQTKNVFEFQLSD